MRITGDPLVLFGLVEVRGTGGIGIAVAGLLLVLWMFEHGVMPLYTPLGGSWLNMAESVQRILARRALEGQHPATADQIIEWLETTARGWNRQPTPFEWGGKRKARRERARARRRTLAGSGACTRQTIQVPLVTAEKRLCA